MRYLIASLMLSLLLTVGASLPAAAQSSGPVREGSSERWSEGIHFRKAAPARSHRLRLSRSTESYDDEYRPRRRYHHHHASRSRYAKHRHARVARHMRRHQRFARRRGVDRNKVTQRKQQPAKHAAIAPTPPTQQAPKKSLGADGQKPRGMHGMASYYWEPQALASGGRFNPNALTAAHKTLPFGTRVRVTHLGNGRSVEVKINDRGPYVAGRIIDLSKAAAGVIGMTAQGVARVVVEVLGK